MKYLCAVISVNDINLSRRFYEELFGLRVYQDFGKNISFGCGLALQEDFAWLVNLPPDKILKEANDNELYFEEKDFEGFLEKLNQYPDLKYLHGVFEHGWGQRVVRFYDPDGHLIEVGEAMEAVVKRFLDSGLSKEETAKRMGVSPADIEKFLRG